MSCHVCETISIYNHYAPNNIETILIMSLFNATQHRYHVEEKGKVKAQAGGTCHPSFQFQIFHFSYVHIIIIASLSSSSKKFFSEFFQADAFTEKEREKKVFQ